MHNLDYLKELVSDMTAKNEIQKAVISNKRNKTQLLHKVNIRPIILKGELYFQLEEHQSDKVFHSNIKPSQLPDKINGYLKVSFKELNVFTPSYNFQILSNKTEDIKILKTAVKTEPINKEDMEHNRKKQYILEEGRSVPYLVKLGIMDENGLVFPSMHKKYAQINRFVELFESALPPLNETDKNMPVEIIDFGCGKSYLTFALQYYLENIKKLSASFTGVDLKEDVISKCTGLSNYLGIHNMKFIYGDIKDFSPEKTPFAVISLHACDTATDWAIAKGILWNARTALSVPCCHKELFTQVTNNVMDPMLNHGIIKDRFSALLTDSLRAKLLEAFGYKTDIIEFIDMEHTPKNIMIRAVKKSKYALDMPGVKDTKSLEEYRKLRDFYSVRPTLERLLIP